MPAWQSDPPGRLLQRQAPEIAAAAIVGARDTRARAALHRLLRLLGLDLFSGGGFRTRLDCKLLTLDF